MKRNYHIGTFSQFKQFVRNVLAGKRQVQPDDPKVWVEPDASRTAAIRRLATFGKRHHLSLGNITIADLRRESRPQPPDWLDRLWDSAKQAELEAEVAGPKPR
jgi:hypothetical protein